MASILAMRICVRALADGAAEERHALDADIDPDQPPGHCRAGHVDRPHVAAEQLSALAEDAVEDGAAGLDEIDRCAVPVEDIDAAARHRRDPEVAADVDL